MKKYIKCKVCGFIGKDNKNIKICPACGAPITDFENYTYEISETRLKKLNMHIHPVLAHFPQSLAFLSFAFIATAFITKGSINTNSIIIGKYLSIILPFSIIAAMGSGVYDTKTRLQNTNGSIIKEKIQLGTLFLVSSGVTAVMFNYEVSNSISKAIIVILGIFNLICSALLGNRGTSLLDVVIKDKK